MPLSLFLTENNTTEYKAIQLKVFHLNTSRVFYLVLIAIPVSLIHIAVFYFRLDEPGTTEYIWRIGIIASHGLLILANVFVGLLSLLYRKKKKPGFILYRSFMYFGFILIIASAAAIAGFDQLVTPSITPFLVICVVLALVFVFEPWHALAFYFVAYILFYLSISHFQADPVIALSNNVNGLTSAGLGFFLSFIMWTNTRDKIRQALVISKQSEDLERRNQELLSQSKVLEDALHTRDKFFSIISHDLRTPFNALLGFSNILVNDWNTMDEEEKKNIVGMIKETSLSTFQMLVNLLDWSRMQKEQLQVTPDIIYMLRLIDHVIIQLQAQAKLKNISFEVSVEPKLTVIADEHMMRSLLRNLLSNAIKFSEASEKVIVTAKADGPYMVCSVEDHGVGMSQEKIETLFSTSFTTAGTDKEPGSGIGLQLCQEYVRLHHGTIWAESKKGNGSVFCFRIPRDFSA